MAVKIQTMLKKAEISQAQKDTLAASKVLVSVATKTDLGGLTSYADTLAYVVNVVLQRGNGKGKRIRGAATHETQDQIVALQNLITNKEPVIVD